MVTDETKCAQSLVIAPLSPLLLLYECPKRSFRTTPEIQKENEYKFDLYVVFEREARNINRPFLMLSQEYHLCHSLISQKMLEHQHSYALKYRYSYLKDQR